MILQDVKKFLAGTKQASAGEITRFLGEDRQVVLHALRLLVRKGQVTEVKQHQPCASCSCGSSCSSHQTVHYCLAGTDRSP